MATLSSQFKGFGAKHRKDHWEPTSSSGHLIGEKAETSKTMSVDKPKLPKPPTKHPHRRHAHRIARRAH